MSQTESGGRYDRSPSGLVAAMIVTLAAVIAVVLFRSFISDDVEVEPDDVAYLEVVEQAQSAGLAPVYPPELPEGWQATGAELSPGTPPGFVLNLLTDDEKFVGVRQEVESVDDLLEEYVVEDTEEGDPSAGDRVGRTHVGDLQRLRWRSRVRRRARWHERAGLRLRGARRHRAGRRLADYSSASDAFSFSMTASRR